MGTFDTGLRQAQSLLRMSGEGEAKNPLILRSRCACRTGVSKDRYRPSPLRAFLIAR